MNNKLGYCKDCKHYVYKNIGTKKCTNVNIGKCDIYTNSLFEPNEHVKKDLKLNNKQKQKIMSDTNRPCTECKYFNGTTCTNYTDANCLLPTHDLFEPKEPVVTDLEKFQSFLNSYGIKTVHDTDHNCLIIEDYEGSKCKTTLCCSVRIDFDAENKFEMFNVLD